MRQSEINFEEIQKSFLAIASPHGKEKSQSPNDINNNGQMYVSVKKVL